jgi:uncharacterized protein YecT (DUF1311 family)
MKQPRILLLVSVVAAVGVAGCSSSSSGGASPAGTSPGTPQTTPSTVPGETLTLPTVSESFTVLPCPSHTPQTTLEIEGCAEHRIVRLDKQINNAAHGLYAAMPDGHAQADFASAQQAWIAYRRAVCLSESDANAGGSLAAVTYASCEVRIDRQRLGDLDRLRAQSTP